MNSIRSIVSAFVLLGISFGAVAGAHANVTVDNGVARNMNLGLCSGYVSLVKSLDAYTTAIQNGEAAGQSAEQLAPKKAIQASIATMAADSGKKIGVTLTAQGELSDEALHAQKIIGVENVPLVILGTRYPGGLQLNLTLAGICPYFSASDLQNWRTADVQAIAQRALNAL